MSRFSNLIAGMRKPVSWKTVIMCALVAWPVGMLVAQAAQTHLLGVVFVADPTVTTRQMTVNADGSINVQTAAGGTDTVIGNVTPADGAALGTTSVRTYSLGGLFNGTTVDLYREAVNGANSTGTGIAANAMVGQLDDTSTNTCTENQFCNARISSKGVMYATLFDSGNNVVVQLGADNADGQATSGTGNRLFAISKTQVFNGTTWDRAFSCPNFAAISVTAANTTQIIALSGSTVIRVCNINVSTSLTGSWTLLSGTGSNCGTPANSTGAMPITTGTAVQIGDGTAAIYRGSAGGELCIAAVTGNITGWVMYAQY